MEKLEAKEELVTFDSVSKDYKGFLALNGLTFQIKKGEILGYVGPNGAGKTTTMKVMVGLVSDFTGKLNIAGYKLPAKRHEAHKIMGYLPQNVAFQEWRTVEHALSSFGALSGIDRKDIDSRIEKALRVVGISEFRHKKIIELSGGNVQKVGLAQALLHDPALLILDEPLSGLDPASRYNVKQILKEISRNGTTVFFSSHILSDVQDVATRIAILNRGYLMKIGSIEEFKSEFTVPHTVMIEVKPPFKDSEGLRAISGVMAMESPSEGRVMVSIDPRRSPEGVLTHILQKLLSDGQLIRSVGTSSPNLDELYLKYVTRGCAQ